MPARVAVSPRFVCCFAGTSLISVKQNALPALRAIDAALARRGTDSADGADAGAGGAGLAATAMHRASSRGKS